MLRRALVLIVSSCVLSALSACGGGAKTTASSTHAGSSSAASKVKKADDPEQIQEFPEVQGWGVNQLCVSADGNTLSTLDPQNVCVQMSNDTDGTCIKWAQQIVSFDRNKAIETCVNWSYPTNCQDCTAECVQYSYSPAPLTYTVPVMEIDYPTNCQDCTPTETQVSSFIFTLPTCQ
jgi:hypothetical protein